MSITSFTRFGKTSDNDVLPPGLDRGTALSARRTDRSKILKMMKMIMWRWWKWFSIMVRRNGMNNTKLRMMTMT